MNKDRNPSLDVLRIFAFFLVVSLHFLSASGFMELEVGGKKAFVMYSVRAITVCCVPIFIMLTGYLQTNKTLGIKYYRGIVRPAVTYIIAALCAMIYKIVFYNYSSNPFSVALKILDFSASDYGWYMEMYFGLFIMIPFLNAAYHGMKSKKQKIVLVCTFLVITALPAILNTFNFTADGWWSNPTSSKSYNKLLPGWWTGIYPITYYFIGSYLREFPLKIKKWINILLIIAFAFVFGAYNYYRLKGGVFFYGAFLNNASLFVAVEAVLMFSLIAESDMRFFPLPIKRVLSVISGWTLPAYLISFIFDVRLYKILKAAVPVVENRVYYAPVMVISVFLCSLVCGGVIDTVYRFGEFVIRKLIKSHR